MPFENNKPLKTGSLMVTGSPLCRTLPISFKNLIQADETSSFFPSSSVLKPSTDSPFTFSDDLLTVTFWAVSENEIRTARQQKIDLFIGRLLNDCQIY